MSERRSGFHLADVLTPLVAEAEQKGVVVKMDVDATAWVRARATAVVEILHRLLENARLHAPGSPVSIGVERVGGHVRIRVADAGPGLPARHRARALDPGWRRPDSPGAGLGLFIAAELAREQGGYLRLEEGPDGGVAAVVML